MLESTFLMKMKPLVLFMFYFMIFPHHGSSVVADTLSAINGDSITLHTGVKKTEQDRIRWYFKDIRIAQVNGDPSKTCTDVQCNDGNENFRDRLKLDHQTGSLTIVNIRNTDAGDYQLKFYSSSSISEKTFSVSVQDVDPNKVSVSAMEGDSVILDTSVEKTQQDRIRWYFKDIRIAQVNGDPSKTCTDVQCNDGNENFRDRLKLDHQTGSLTIVNFRNTDAGDYQLKFYSSSSISEKTFSVSVRGGSAADKIKKSVKVGESLTLDPSEINSKGLMTWYFDGIRIAEVPVPPNKVCAEDQCKEIFGDRLKVDHQTGSLTITNTKITDSGLYEVEISSHSRRQRRSISSVKSFNVDVIGSSLAIVTAISVAVLLVVVVVVAVIYYRHRRHHALGGSTVQQLYYISVFKG